MKHILIAIFSWSLLFNTALSAQVKEPIQGEIELESYDAVEDTAPDKRSNTIDFLKSFLGDLAALTKGKSEKITPMSSLEDPKSPATFSNYALNHLALAYLRCSVAEGTCPAVLESVMEVDLINSKISGTVSCPNMQRFWKSWIENDMEKRQQHQVQIGYLKDTENFNRDVRPKFIKCKETVTATLAENSATGSDFFKARYADDRIKKSVERTINILEALEKSNGAAFDLEK